MTLYRVGTSYARKVWVWPRLRQLATRARCLLSGHQWTDWHIDDMDGPGEHLPDGGWMPLLARTSRPGEFGTRACRRWCGALQTRWPRGTAPRAPGRLQDRGD